MFTDPKYKNLVNDIAGVLAEHNKAHYENLLPEAVVAQIDLCAEEISEMDLGYRTAENIGKAMKSHFYEGTRQARIEPTHEMSAEFYRRVYNVLSELKMPKTDRVGRIKSQKVRDAYAKGSFKAALTAKKGMDTAKQQRKAGDEEGAAETRRSALGATGKMYDRSRKASY